MEIRPIHPAEHDALAELTVTGYLTVTSVEGYEESLRDVASRAADAEVLVAVGDDGTLLGGVTYVNDPANRWADFDDPGGACIRMLAVAPGARNGGVGTALVEACLARARAEGKAKMILLSTPPMTAAHRIYTRLGFRRAPERDWSPAPGVDLMGFELDLTAPGGATDVVGTEGVEPSLRPS